MTGRYNVSPSDYRDHRELALGGKDLWENNGWMVWNRAGNEDLLLWLSPYRIVGRQPGGPYAVDDIALSQTMLLRSRYEGSDRLVMHDTPYLEVGYDLGDHLPGDALMVSVDANAAHWRVGNRKFTAQPPRWQITGEHAGVNVDLSFEALGPAFWFTDPAQSVETLQERWFLLNARVRGTVTYQGEPISIDGYGSHERHVHCGVRYNPIRTLSARGLTWQTGCTDRLQVLTFSRPSLDVAWSRLALDGRVIDFSKPSHKCEVEETDFWVDPLSRVQIPCAWRSAFSGPSGRLEITARAFARSYYLWPHYREGCTILYWWMADAEVSYDLADGESGRVSNLQYIIHDNRLLYRRQGL